MFSLCFKTWNLKRQCHMLIEVFQVTGKNAPVTYKNVLFVSSTPHHEQDSNSQL
jgi:hypothetical protein